MSSQKTKVFVTRKLPAVVELRLSELFDTTLNDRDEPLTRDELIEAVRTSDVLVPTVTDQIDEDLLSQAGDNLKLIAHFGAGYDNIDVEFANSRGIIVTNTPGVLTEDTADLTMALLLSVPRRIIEGVKVIENKQFNGWSPTWMMGRRITGKKLGIIGLGRIGQAVARRAKAFGMEIHYHNRKPVNDLISSQLDATYWDSLDQMLPRMDFISVHCPHTPATNNLLSARRLEIIPPHAYIINTARGQIIDEDALIAALKEKRIAGAGLDVFANEPHISSELKALSNAVLLPRMGSATVDSRIEMGEKVIINIRSFIDGHKPRDRVIPTMS